MNMRSLVTFGSLGVAAAAALGAAYMVVTMPEDRSQLPMADVPAVEAVEAPVVLSETQTTTTYAGLAYENGQVFPVAGVEQTRSTLSGERIVTVNLPSQNGLNRAEDVAVPANEDIGISYYGPARVTVQYSNAATGMNYGHDVTISRKDSGVGVTVTAPLERRP